MRRPRALDICRLGSPVLVAAPHPDDESLGCGGLVARLRRIGAAVFVVIVSDGGASHHSPTWPRARLAACRREEAEVALDRLSVPRQARQFWQERDAAVPGPGTARFGEVVERAGALLRQLRPMTLVLPWRRDPHCDHQATAAIFDSAARQAGHRPRVLEYPGWTGILPNAAALPRVSEVVTWRLDLRRVHGVKARAVDAHRSQLGLLIEDDPAGFVLTAPLRRRFERSDEIFWEVSRK